MPAILAPPPTKPTPQRDYFSFSAIRTYQGCPLRYFYRYLANLPEESIAASLLFGNSFHAALEAHYRALLVGDDPPDRDGLLHAFWAAWKARADVEIRFGANDSLDSLGHLADRMFQAFLVSDLRTPRGHIIGIEEELRAPLIPSMPDLLARVDLIVEEPEGVLVTDFKTSRTHWDEDDAANAADQLLLYSDLIRPLAQGKPLRLEFAVFTKTKTPSVTRLPVVPDQRQLDRTKLIVERVWDSIVHEHFYPNPSAMQCSTCPFRQPCRHWQG